MSRGSAVAASLCLVTIVGCGASPTTSRRQHIARSATGATGPSIRPNTTPRAEPQQPQTTRARPVLIGQIPDRLPTARHVVALAFDAGADNAGAPKILATLARAGVTATFFMTGRWAELYPQCAKRIAARYAIGNHTFDHQDLLGLTPQAVRHELLMAKGAIKHATGSPPLAMFRFPYGSSNASTLALVNHLGSTAVGWTVDTLGWEGTSIGQSLASVTSRALGDLSQARSSSCTLARTRTITQPSTPTPCLGIIRAIRARGGSIRHPEPVLLT